MARFISASASNLATLQSPTLKNDLKRLEESTDVFARESGYSSTPHAPRCRKPFPFGSLHSAKAINRSYKYLSNDRIKAWSSNTEMDKQKKDKAEEKKVVETEVSYRPEAIKPTVVKPFRRATGTMAPDCVPELDLRRLNEPDEEMSPIELVSFLHPLVMDTQRTDLSWGTSRDVKPDIQETTVRAVKRNKPGMVVEKAGDDDLTVKDEEGEEEEKSIINPDTLEASHLKYVESCVVSEERGREEICHPTQQTHPLDQTKGGGTAPGPLYEKALSKRIRFNARVLTQSGRDVHRELCGFFFLADGSLTIYELRQFGQKISALPLIQRAVYKHPVGRRSGELYEIRHVKKGATLYFESSSLPSLPESLKKRSIIGIRISHVDEEAKWSLMKKDLKPSQHSQVQSYLCQSPSEESKRHGDLLQTLQGMLCNRLEGRGSQALVGLGRYLKRQATPDGLVEKILLEQGMRAYHISLTPENFDQLWDLLQEEHFFISPNRKQCSQEGVWLDRIISGLVGEMSEDRKSIIRKAFLKMDSTKFGSVPVSQLHKHFCPQAHPDVVSKKMTAEELLHSLFVCLQPPIGVGPKQDRGRVTYADFEHYYKGVSIDVRSDREFINAVMRCWSV